MNDPFLREDVAGSAAVDLGLEDADVGQIAVFLGVFPVVGVERLWVCLCFGVAGGARGLGVVWLFLLSGVFLRTMICSVVAVILGFLLGNVEINKSFDYANACF